MTLPPGSDLPLCHDAVFFDLDGTLIATDRFWIEAARRGARRAFASLGLARALPRDEQWLGLVGQPLELGFRSLFPDLGELQRRRVLDACVEEEEALLREGGVPAMPGAPELLRALHARGHLLGVASNCQRAYLECMLDGLALRPLLRGAYCRESPGIDTKGDMLARLLEDTGTRSAVMVGDRASDRDAAWDNGLPHVHCAFGFAQGDEAVEAEGRIESLAELPALLARRGRWIEEALERVGAFARHGLRLGITGGPAAGKTLFARDAARVLVARGIPAAAVSLVDFPAATGSRTDDPLEGALDLARLAEEVLRPHEAGREVRLVRPDLLGGDVVPPGATLLLEGAHLLGARLRLSLDRLIHLGIGDRESAGRTRGRSARGRGLAEVAAELEPAFAVQRALEHRYPPAEAADLTLEAGNPLGAPEPSPVAPSPPGGAPRASGLGARDRAR